MLKHINEKQIKKYSKKGISIATATIMLMANMQLGETWPLFRNVSKRIIAYAESTYEYDETTKVATIKSVEDLVEYSGKYYTDSIDHTEDIIYIDLTGNTTVPYTGFQSIGSDAKPFKGKIRFETASATNFNISEPLFGTVYDSVKIVKLNNDVEENTSITISKSASNQYDPLFAVRVMHDSSITRIEDAPSWSVTATSFAWLDNNDTFSNAGFIEAIDENAFVNITIVNNVYTGSEGAIVENDDDVGTICGKLGASAVLKANYSGTNVDYTIESNAGHAGGMVGSMASESTLDLTISSNPQTTTSAYVKTSASGKYAGGLVGYNYDGTVAITCSGSYAINQMICGMSGEGGIYGYYYTSSANSEFDVSNYSVACLLNTLSAGVGNAGALIGECTNAGSLTIKGDSSSYTSVESTLNTLGDSRDYVQSEIYGGLIGKYSANSTLANTLIIQDFSVSVNNTLGAAKYGGCVAVSSGLAYVEFDNISIDSTDHNKSGVSFGGLIDEANNSYVYAKDITVGSSTKKITSFAGGGLINSLNYGVLRMSDTINLQYVEPTAAATNGQIVAIRDHALIYADAGWGYSRSSSKVDNVGSWGDVIVFNTLASDSASGGKLVKANVLTENADHTITITSPASNTIASAEDFAKISILWQIDIGNATSKNRILSGTNIAGSTVLSSTGTIYLKDTGLRGITRDNGTTNIEYSGSTFDGNSGKIVLDIQNVGGKPVYYHSLNGLFGCSNGTEFKNVTFDGTITIDGAVDNIYVGTAAATAKGALGLTSCNTSSTLNISIGGEKAGYAGRMIGYATTAIGDITATGGTYDGTISITNNKGGTRLGGVIGCIAHNTNAAVIWDFSNITLKGIIQNTSTTTAEVDQKFGGLVASIGNYTPDGTSKDLRTMTLDVEIDGLQITGKTTGTMGGLLGYSWPNTNVNVTDVKLINTPTITLNAAGNVSGLVGSASGHWQFTSLDMSNLKVTAGTAKSIGFIVNKGYTSAQTSGIYLELDPSVYTLSLTDSTLPDQTDASKFVYDEICAYSSNGGIMKNGQGIISIKSTDGLKMESSATPSLSYTAKTTKGQNKDYENPNTRYYYNLDAIDDDNTESGLISSQKLLRWGVQQYACPNIKPYFTSSFTTTTTVDDVTTTNHSIPTGIYSMEGYSWYPVSVSDPITIAGTFEFFNEEFEKCETGTNGKSNTQLSPNLATQHYMMQNGLLYNVSSNLTIGNVTLKGTIGAVDTTGTGALVYGTVSGEDADNITTVSSENGSISLDGIRVHNYSAKSSSYAPLLINTTGDTGFVTIDIYHVSNTNNSAYSDGSTIATSLLGKMGSSSAKYLNLTFSDVKLDGRKTSDKPSQISSGSTDTYGYHTKKSLFSRATLLERFSYDTDSSGVYNFTYDEDWGGNKPHDVTYGQELGYVNGTPSETNKNQYPDQELQYSGSAYYVAYKQNNNGPFTDVDSTVSNTFRSEFLRYVADVDTSNYKYQLMVNHHSITLNGCGTYNDPYIIDEAAKLEGVSRMIRGTFNVGDTLCIPALGLNATWCTDKTTPNHVSCSYDGSNVGAYTKDQVAQHLAGAYYQVNLPVGATSITISNENDFQGLGSSSAATMFRGVIDGNGYTIINQTKYPLIAYSNGSVVYNLTVRMDKAITLEGKKDKEEYPSNDRAYGAVIGQIHGGDNIIDTVTVDYNKVITLNGSYAYKVPVGGYVGVVVKGGLIFRNMTGITSKLTNADITATSVGGRAVNAMTSSDSNVWMYVNPYVGRVINGYVVNEAGAYHAREADQTLKNGNKHYSITDIGNSTKLTVNSSYKITVPDAQSFFILSLIVNSGMGSLTDYNNTGDGLLGYYNGYSVTRHADYDEIGETSSTDYTDRAINDICWAINKAGTDQPYLIQQYVSSLYAKAIGNKNGCEVVLSSDSYVLPDGFKGIGNIFTSNDLLRLRVKKFTGNSATIDQNTQFNYYSTEVADNYRPMNADNYCGLGLFNAQTYNGGTFSNFTLTGNVKCNIVNSSSATGANATYSSYQNYNPSVGMLFGCLYGKITLNDFAVNNITVQGPKTTGGLIGYAPRAYTDTNYKNNPPTYDITINTTRNSTGITVQGGMSTGGMVGRIQQSTISIDFHGAHFDIDEVTCNGTYEPIRTGDKRNDYNFGVGGFIGVLRARQSYSPASSDEPVANHVNNVVIGTTTDTATVECSSTAKFYMGGVVGVINKSNGLEINNCTFNNVSVTSNAYAGGLVGFVSTNSPTIVKDTEFYSNRTSTITGNEYGGGMIGWSYDASDGAWYFQALDCSIDGYTISGQNAGGVIGERGGRTDVDTLRLENFIIKNCAVKGSDNVGGIAGKLNKPMNGYNILAQNVRFEHIDSTKTIENISNLGFIVGRNESLVKLVAISRQETDPTKTMIAETVGSSSFTNNIYGNGGYVVFSDYTGVQTNTHFSGINASSNITSCSSPYVHVNPKATVEGTGYNEIFLTGDGVSPLTQVTGGYASAALKGINDDAQAEKPNYILPIDSYDSTDLTEYKEDMQTLYNTYISRQSTFAFEASDKLIGVSGYEFPVLVLDISNAKQSTEYINNYIHLMTNTSSSTFSNYANDEANKYQVILTKYKYDKTQGKLVVADDAACFYKEEGKFRMNPNNTDTIANDAQFTLMDIQFFDPTDPTKIAYHLYIPVYCRKLLEYDFHIELKSGTNYGRTDDVDDIRATNEENLLIENIGVPITMEFAYSYKRTLKEWQDALEGGDTLLTPYTPRKLEFKNSTYVAEGGTINSFPSSTQMVLVDVNRNSKAYYLNSLTSTSFSAPDSNSISYLNLNSFTASDGKTFTPPSFCDSLIVTVLPDEEGKFVATDSTGITGEASADGTPTVKANSGTYNDKGFRLAEDADTDATRYSVTLAFPPGVTELTEHYFLTIYTPAPKHDEDDNTEEETTPVVYHYEIGTKSALTDDGKPYPSKVTTAYNQRSDLYLGEIYNNNVEIVSLSDPQMITKDNNSITAQVKATISLTDAGWYNVKTNLDKASLYQSFLIKMNKFNEKLKKSEVGILAEHIQVAPSDGKIGKEGDLSNAEMTWSGNSNYIEVKSNQSISGIIKTNSGERLEDKKDTIISATVVMTFDPESDDISNQFYGQPTEDEIKGTHIIAYSNIASSNSQTAYSKVYDKVENPKIYYTADTQEAILSYDAVTVAGKGQLPQLGINRKDSNESAVSIIKTQGNYGISNCLTAASECDYVKCKISLMRKKDDGTYTAPLVLSDYISNVSFMASYTSVSNSNEATEWIYVFDKKDLTLANNVYSIPFDLTIISGSDFETGTDTDDQKRKYSNYKIKLEVSMQETSATDATDKTGTWSTDYLIYTHAKLYTGRVEPVTVANP